MFKALFESVEMITPMPESEKALCYKYFEPIEYEKDTILEYAGKIPGHQYFIASGLLRNFYLNENGEEITTDMNNGPRFFTSYTAFVNRSISNETIQCVTRSSLLRIKRDDVDVLFQKSEILIKYTMLLFERVFQEERNRINDLATLSAADRYIKFVQEQPNIVKYAPLQYIASYLGMSAETLSRIRRKTIS